MNKLYPIIVVLAVLGAGCSEKKSNNPLTANNIAPTLQLIGFSADTLVYIEKKFYSFDFIAEDEITKTPEITAKVFGGTGTISIIDNTAAGRYRGQFMPSGKGSHTIEITVSDGLEATTKTLSVYFGDNKAPVAVIRFRELQRDVPNARFTFEFDASSSVDRDSKIVRALWNLDGAAMQMDVDKKVEHTFAYYSNYEIELTVEDEFGGKNKTEMTIDNSRPQASFAIRPTAETTNGNQITLDATASSSPHANIITYKWFSKHQAEGLNVLVETTSSIFRFDVNMQVGENDVGLIVRDEEGNLSDTSWVKLTVLNQAPQAGFTFNTELQRIIVNGNQSEDPDPGDSISLDWFLNGVQQADKHNEKLPSFDVPGDVYQVTLTVTDNHGESNSTSRTISVPGVPEARFNFPDGIEDNFETANAKRHTLDGRQSIAGNESSGIETFTWLLRATDQAIKVLSEGSASFYQFDVSHPVGEYEIGLKVKNLEGLESVTKWKHLKVLNSNPIADFTCEFQAFAEGLVYKIVSNESGDVDPDDPIKYEWFLDGVRQQNVTSATPTFTRTHSNPVDTITLRVIDSHNGVGEKSVTGGCN